MSMDTSDWYESGSLSSCCGASVINLASDKMGVCSDCREPCEIVSENEEEE